MERVIKFQYGFESINGIIKKVYYLSQIPTIKDRCDVWDVLPVAYVRQFTELKDKNGKEIYEGDILNCQDRIVKVVWHNESGQWDTDFIRYIFDLCSNGITNQEWKYRAIVIGNIHENPELLSNGS